MLTWFACKLPSVPTVFNRDLVSWFLGWTDAIRNPSWVQGPLRDSYLLSQLVQHASADGCRVRAQDVLLGLFDLPVIFVPARRLKRYDIPASREARGLLRQTFLPLRAVSSLRVNLLHSLEIILREVVRKCRVWKNQIFGVLLKHIQYMTSKSSVGDIHT